MKNGRRAKLGALLVSSFFILHSSFFIGFAAPAPPQRRVATQAEVNSGISSNTDVTPLTLKGWTGVIAGTNGIGVTSGTGIVTSTNGGVISVALYTAPVISSFSNNRNTLEQGSTNASTALTWVLTGGAITSQSINQGLGTLDVALRTTNHTQAFTTNRTYTLTTSDGVTTNTAATSVTFLSQIYWGVSAETSLDDSEVLGLADSDFATTRALAPPNITAAAQYLYFAYPASFGAASFTVNGLPNTAWTLVTRDFVNASGYSLSYRIYRSDNLLSGTYTVVIQ